MFLRQCESQQIDTSLKNEQVLDIRSRVSFHVACFLSRRYKPYPGGHWEPLCESAGNITDGERIAINSSPLQALLIGLHNKIIIRSQQ